MLREQEDQMDHLYTAVNVNAVVKTSAVAAGRHVDNDDASTIDQDISSLADDNEDLDEVLKLLLGPEMKVPTPIFWN